MMSTNIENYVNDINEATFTSGTSSGKRASRDSEVVIQRNPYGVRVLGRGARSKNKRQSPPASPSGSSTNVPATRLEKRMEVAQSIRTRDNVAHSRVNHHQLLLDNWNILTLTGKKLELVEEAKRYQLDIIGQRWSRGHKARGQGQGQGHKKKPRPRPRTAFPRTDTLEAKDRNAQGQGQGPRTQVQVLSKITKIF